MARDVNIRQKVTWKWDENWWPFLHAQHYREVNFRNSKASRLTDGDFHGFWSEYGRTNLYYLASGERLKKQNRGSSFEYGGERVMTLGKSRFQQEKSLKYRKIYSFAERFNDNSAICGSRHVFDILAWDLLTCFGYSLQQITTLLVRSSRNSPADGVSVMHKIIILELKSLFKEHCSWTMTMSLSHFFCIIGDSWNPMSNSSTTHLYHGW